MAVLLDTHVFLWCCEDSTEISPTARREILKEDCLVSLVSFWEIAIKTSTGKLRLPAAIERYLPEQMKLMGFDALDVNFRQTIGVASLPWHHRDPFDRLLAAQALEKKVSMVSRDPVFDTYGVKRIW